MSTYALIVVADTNGEAKRIEFEATNPAKVLEIVRGEAAGRLIQVWKDQELVCTLRRSRGVHFWRIGQQPGGQTAVLGKHGASPEIPQSAKASDQKPLGRGSPQGAANLGEMSE